MVHQVACKHCKKAIRSANQKAADRPGTIIGIISTQECKTCNKYGPREPKPKAAPAKPAKPSRPPLSELRIYVFKVWWPEGGHEYLRTAGWSDKDATGRMTRRLQEEGTPAKLLQVHSKAKLPI